MELIPHDELKPANGFNFAPMIDFLFLMLALFATLAVSRAALYDTEVELVELKAENGAASLRAKEIQQINLSITDTGGYKWLTEFQEYSMQTVLEIQEELARQYQIGALAEDKDKTEILLHIDKRAPWEPIANAIFAVREIGFNARPVYDASQ
jgi:biopolymer transport protein ExbD